MKDYSFGNYICALRTGLGLSQFQLGTLVGVTDKAVSKWENGDAKPRISTCHRLAEVLGVSIQELLSCKQYIALPARKELQIMKHTLWKEAYQRLTMYSDTPPLTCLSRLAAEESALRKTSVIESFAALGQIRRALEAQGTSMFVAGTVNNSFTAWLFGATNVNPLKPHYRCPRCGKTEFVSDVTEGFDLPEKDCDCGEAYLRDGHDLPCDAYALSVQTGNFLEIRLSKSAFDIARDALYGFYEGKAEILPLLCGNPGIIRYVVLSENKPKPPLESDGFWHTDGDEFWEWVGNQTTYTLIPSNQFDPLNQRNTPLPDPVTLMTPVMAQRLFSSVSNPRAIPLEQWSAEVDYDLLWRIKGLTQGTGVWEENAEELIARGIASIREIPAHREDIRNQIQAALMAHNIEDSGLALMIMEKARKGLFNTKGIDPGIENALKDLNLPAWYPDYLRKCRYLFPKGHCISFLLTEALVQWATGF